MVLCEQIVSSGTGSPVFREHPRTLPREGRKNREPEKNKQKDGKCPHDTTKVPQLQDITTSASLGHSDRINHIMVNYLFSAYYLSLIKWERSQCFFLSQFKHSLISLLKERESDFHADIFQVLT